jgi:hypothetical protein
MNVFCWDFRLIGGLGPPTSNPVMTGIPSAPVILPVFPISQPHPGQAMAGNGTATNSRSLQRNQYSPSRFTIQKDCHVSDRCSWKCISIALILLCIALMSIVIYFAGKDFNKEYSLFYWMMMMMMFSLSPFVVYLPSQNILN